LRDAVHGDPESVAATLSALFYTHMIDLVDRKHLPRTCGMLMLLVPDRSNSDERRRDSAFGESKHEPYGGEAGEALRRGQAHTNCSPDDTVRESQ
jgi:hypothetical protein